MTKDEALMWEIKALQEATMIAIKEALTQPEQKSATEKALQALHDENERLGLYKEAYGFEPWAWAVIKDGICVAVRRFEPYKTSEMDGTTFVPLYPKEST